LVVMKKKRRERRNEQKDEKNKIKNAKKLFLSSPFQFFSSSTHLGDLLDVDKVLGLVGVWGDDLGAAGDLSVLVFVEFFLVSSS